MSTSRSNRTTIRFSASFADVGAMFTKGLIEVGELLRLFSQIEPELYRFPAIDPPSFRRRVKAITDARLSESAGDPPA